MGNDLNACCKNTFVLKSSEKDIAVVKKDLRERKRINTENQISNNTSNSKIKKSIEFEQITKRLVNSNQNSQIGINHTQDHNAYSFSFNQNNIRIQKLSNLINNSPILFLKVLNQTNEFIKKGQIFKINCQGLADGLTSRKSYDGITYFGILKHKSKLEEEGLDVLLDIEEDNDSSSSVQGKHFKIEFNIDKMSYFISDLGNGYGTFVKLDFPWKIKDNQLINIGDTYIVCNIQDKSTENDLSQSNLDLSKSLRVNHLKLKIFSTNDTGKHYYFPPSGSIISIGRFSLADIQIEDNLLSKIHCTITYNSTEGWIISDGHEGKSSTNGTWLFLSEEYEIYDTMIFKHNQTIFQIGKV